MTGNKNTKLPFYTGIFYFFVRPLARIGIWMYFRKIYLSHADRIPKNKPVLLASNHPTGFMEPCVMAVFLSRPLSFLVRGNFFRKPIFNFLLRSLNMIPIFRKRDGNFRDLKSNYHSFQVCYQALYNNKTIMIFPEGNAAHEKRLRPIQKGISRMAYGIFEAYPDIEDLYIVPVSVSYTYAENPRSEMMLSCAPAISVRGILKENEGHFARFDKALRAKVTADMLDNLVHIEKQEDEALIEKLHQIHRASILDQKVFPVLSKDSTLLINDKSIADKVHDWDQATKNKLGEKATQFLEQIKGYNFPVKTLTRKRQSGFFHLLMLILTALPVFIGYLFGFLPSKISKNIADSKVTRTEFYSPIMVAAHIGFFLIYYILWAVLSLMLWNIWIFVAALLLGLLAYASLIWRESRLQYIWSKRYQKIDKSVREELIKAYQSILKEIAIPK